MYTITVVISWKMVQGTVIVTTDH